MQQHTLLALDVLHAGGQISRSETLCLQVRLCDHSHIAVAPTVYLPACIGGPLDVRNKMLGAFGHGSFRAD